jgi:PAS domain S-box-containing protein
LKSLEERTRQLERSLSVLRAAIESTSDGILFTDETGHILHFNERYLQICGISREVAEHTAQHQQLLEFHCECLKEPQEFLRRTAEIYATSPEESRDLMEL